MEFKNLRIKDISYIVNYVPTQMHFTSKNKPYHIIGVKLQGSALHTFDNGNSFTMTQNSIYFLNQNEDYTVDVLEKSEALSIHFETYEPIETPSFCIKLADTSEILTLIEGIRRRHSPTQSADSALLSRLYKLCALYSDILEKKYAPKDIRLAEAKKYIDLHFAEKNCLENATKVIGVSRRRFNDLFKSQFSLTPNTYLTFCKLEYAKRLLKSDDFSISDVALLCGFSNVYYFTKSFTEIVGQTPSKFRKG